MFFSPLNISFYSFFQIISAMITCILLSFSFSSYFCLKFYYFLWPAAFNSRVHNGLSEAFRGKIPRNRSLSHLHHRILSEWCTDVGDTALILTAADTFHHICYITGQHFFGSDDSGLLSCGMVCCRSPVNISPLPAPGFPLRW